jgi:hypothetical protein
MSKILRIGVVVLIGVLVVGAMAAWAFPGQAEAAYGTRWGAGTGSRTSTPGTCLLTGSGYTGVLDDSEVQALNLALQDEYRASSLYGQVISDFGAVWPFTTIQSAEQNHIAALVTLFNRYGIQVPANDWTGNVPSFDTLAEACQAGVQTETNNAALYDQLLTMTDQRDLTQVFTSLQRASETNHLPAFELCAP